MAQLKAEKDRADAAEKSAQNARRKMPISRAGESAEAQTHKDAEKREEAESRYESALADISGLKEQNAQLQQSYHDADESRIAANLQRQKAEAERDKAEARAKDAENQLSGSRQVAEAAKLRADKLQEENAALKKQPIAAVVDEEEVDRRAGEKAYEIAAGMTANYKAQQEQDARDAYDSIILAGRSITSIVQSAKMQFRKLPDDQRETAINQFVHTLASAQGRYPHVCKDHGLRGRKRQTHQGRCTHAVAHRAHPRGWQQQSGQDQRAGRAGVGPRRRPLPPGRSPAGRRCGSRPPQGQALQRRGGGTHGQNSTLTVTDPTGRRSGQQLLNAFIEPLALDLPRFMEASDKEKADILLRIIGIGTELHTRDLEIKALYDKRTFTGQLAAQKNTLPRS